MPTEAHREEPLVLGLLGGIASGKTTVARLLVETGLRHGAGALSVSMIVADDVAQEALDDPEVIAAVRAQLGDAVMGADGRLDREAISAAVFDDDRALRRLEEIVHPRVRKRIRKLLEGKGASDVVVLDIPLLAESPFLEECDVLIFVDAPADVRAERARKLRGWSTAEIARRERHQTPLQRKKELSRYTVRNAGSLDETKAGVTEVWSEILKEWKGEASPDTPDSINEGAK